MTSDRWMGVGHSTLPDARAAALEAAAAAVAGRDAGDLVLAAVANKIRAVVRSGHLAGRLGGDEFAVLLRPQPAGRLHPRDGGRSRP